MDDFLKQISNPAWWLSVVVVGLLINLASAYLKPALDGFVERFSGERKRINEHQKALSRRNIQKLLDDPSRVIDLKLDILRLSLRAVLLTVISLFLERLLPGSPFEAIAVLFYNTGALTFPLRLLYAACGYATVILFMYALSNMSTERYLNKVVKEYEKQTSGTQ